MSLDPTSTFNEQYMSINTKLKKRFMRKPNISEATNEFNALAIQCEHSEQPTFAGHAYVGAAECEASLGNTHGEVEYYLAAARQFMKAEMKLHAMRNPSLFNENLESAIGCFMQAYPKYPEKSPLRTSILMELANDLTLLDKKRQAIHYYEMALNEIDDSCMLWVICQRHIMSLNIECGDHDLALHRANAICDCKIDIPQNTIIDLQITRILLVESSECKKVASLEKLFTDLLNDSEELPFIPDLMLNLQSIIISQQAQDLEALVEVSANAKRFLNAQQQELLVHLVKKIEGNQ